METDGKGTCAVTFTGSRSCSARQTSDDGECRHGSTDATTGGRSRRACMHALDLRLNKWHRPAVNHFKSSWTQKYSYKGDNLDDTPTKVNGPKNAVLKLMDLDDTKQKLMDPKMQFQS